MIDAGKLLSGLLGARGTLGKVAQGTTGGKAAMGMGLLGVAMAAQVLAASLLTIDVDTAEEENHLENLRQALGLSVEQARAIAKSVIKAK